MMLIQAEEDMRRTLRTRRTRRKRKGKKKKP